MKATMLLLFTAALLALGAGQALARTSHAASPKTVTVVMRDPGCHWFSVNGGYKLNLAVKGPVKLLNLDEAALKVAGPKGVKLDRVGSKLLLAPGLYRITMVGQASDDNHLKLVVG